MRSPFTRRADPSGAPPEGVRYRTRSKSRIAAAAAACGIVAVAVTGLAAAASRSGTTQPPADPPDPGNFVAQIDNPYFPLVPGTIFKLRGVTDEGVQHERLKVTNRTKEILGVSTTVVKDVLRSHGEVIELTHDWYAQDKEGNVWYFGEATVSYEGGTANTEGSWEAGVDGAEAGIIMNATPEVTDSFRQEYYKGHAEDMYWVVQTDAHKKVPYGNFKNVVRTLEWTPLEPKVVSEKFYASGIGLLGEHDLSGGKENFKLVAIKQP